MAAGIARRRGALARVRAAARATRWRAAGIALLAVGCGGATPPAPETHPLEVWTPFRGEFRSVAGSTESRGRVFRRRDGSLRRETLDASGAPAFVTIENRADVRFYSYSAGRWSSQPWTRTPPAKPTPASFPTAEPQADRVAGHRVVLVYNNLGARIMRAPDLDYAALLEEHPHPPLRVEFLSVEPGPQPDALFAPPPGVVVDRLPWPHTGARH